MYENIVKGVSQPEWPSSKSLQTISAGEGVEKKEPYWWDCKVVQPLWKAVWRVLRKLHIELPFDPAIPLLGIYPEKTTTRKDTCTPVFIGALLTKTWKQPKCPSTEEWIQKRWYIYTQWNIAQPLKGTTYQHFQQHGWT